MHPVSSYNISQDQILVVPDIIQHIHYYGNVYGVFGVLTITIHIHSWFTIQYNEK